MNINDLTVVVEKDEDGNFLAICPALQGCYAEGASKQEALEMIEDAIRLHVEARLEKGEAIEEKVVTRKLTAKEKKILVGIEGAAKQVALHKKGKTELKTLQQILDSL